MIHLVPVYDQYLGRIQPPTGWRFYPDLVRNIHQQPEVTAEEFGEAIYFRTLREGETRVTLSDLDARGQPLYFGPPEDPLPLAAHTTSVGYADSLSASADSSCPTCHGRGYTRPRGKMRWAGCIDCGIAYMSIWRWLVTGHQTSTGKTWIRQAYDTEKEAVRTAKMFNENKPEGFFYLIMERSL